MATLYNPFSLSIAASKHANRWSMRAERFSYIPRVFFELIGFYAIFVIVFIKNTNV